MSFQLVFFGANHQPTKPISSITPFPALQAGEFVKFQNGAQFKVIAVMHQFTAVDWVTFVKLEAATSGVKPGDDNPVPWPTVDGDDPVPWPWTPPSA